MTSTNQDLRQKESRQIYLCAPQGYNVGGTVYLSVKGDPPTVLASARRLVHEMEPRAPVMNMKTVERQLEESLVRERMLASLSTVFTVLAVALAVLGLYGVDGLRGWPTWLRSVRVRSVSASRWALYSGM
jgi:hypothetical protein